MNPLSDSKVHLSEANKTYFGHAYFAFKAGIFLIITGIISLIHGFFPFLFKFKAPQRVMEIAHGILERNHPREIPNDFANAWDVKRKKL